MKDNSNDLIQWLLQGDPWVIYRTRIDLLKEDEKNPLVIKARKEIIEHPKIQSLLKDISHWEITVSSHKNAGQPYHKLSFLADLGLTKSDSDIQKIIDKIFEHISPEGPFQLVMNIPKHFGGKGIDEWAWALCDAPVVIYALYKFGLKDDPKVKKAVDYIAGLVRENGWPCAVSKELGNFRGPGKKNDPCPYATLVSLKLLTEYEEYNESKEVRIGAETLLNLWEKSKDLHPYIFYMGNDFRKIKAPFVWYDILHVLEVLSKIESLKSDKRYLNMLQVLLDKRNSHGKFIAESEWRAWKDWEFGQKKEPSRWITFLALRILEKQKA